MERPTLKERLACDNYPSDADGLHIQALYLQGDVPFVCAVRGMVTIDLIEELEADMVDNDDMFDKGDGDYLFRVSRCAGQMSFPETGQWDFPPHNELEQVGFRPLINRLREMETED